MGGAPGRRDGPPQRVALLFPRRTPESGPGCRLDGRRAGPVGRDAGRRTPAPPAHSPLVPPRRPAELERLYTRCRWRTYESAFSAYATFPLGRTNFAPVSKAIGD